MAAQNYPNAYLGDEAGNRSYAYSSTETVVDKDTGKTLKQILQEGGAGTGAVNTVDGIAPENGNVALLSPAQAAPSGTAIPLDADTLQGHAAGEFAKAVNYSTQEQPTGELWVDGKEIFQKTFSGGALTTGTVVLEENAQIDRIIKSEFCYATAASQFAPSGGFISNQLAAAAIWMNAIAYRTSDKALMAYFTGGTNPSLVDWYVTVSYTKPEE